MRFILQNGKMAEPGGIMDWVNGIGDSFVEKETEWFVKPIIAAGKEGVIFTWHGLVHNLPEIMGYVTILAGAMIVLGAMIGKGGMMRVIAYYAGAMIVSLCILSAQ